MRKKLTIKFVLLTIALAGTFMVLRSSTPVSKVDTCRETLDESCKKHDKSGGVIWENISHQFFSSF
jgi:hypothetical protein